MTVIKSNLKEVKEAPNLEKTTAAKQTQADLFLAASVCPLNRSCVHLSEDEDEMPRQLCA